MVNLGDAGVLIVIVAPFLYSYQEQSVPDTEAEIPASLPAIASAVPEYFSASALASVIVDATPERVHRHCGLVPTDDEVVPGTPAGASGSSANPVDVTVKAVIKPTIAKGVAIAANIFCLFICNPFLGFEVSKHYYVFSTSLTVPKNEV